MRGAPPIAFVLAVLASAPAAAKNISITLAPTVEVSAGTFTLRVKIGNAGDEAAQSVTPVLHFGEKETRGQTKQSLGPNESFDQSLSLPIGDLKPGRWPFQLRVDYTDANQYPFQALQVNAVLVGQPPPAKMTVPLVKPDPLATTSPLHVRLKNLTGTARTVAVSVLVPEGLDVAEPIQPVALAGWEDKPVTAQLVNRSALPGSKYPVYRRRVRRRRRPPVGYRAERGRDRRGEIVLRTAAVVHHRRCDPPRGRLAVDHRLAGERPRERAAGERSPLSAVTTPQHALRTRRRRALGRGRRPRDRVPARAPVPAQARSRRPR